MVVFDHVAKLVHIVRLVEVDDPDCAGDRYDHAIDEIRRTMDRLTDENVALRPGVFPAPSEVSRGEAISNMTREQHAAMVERAGIHPPAIFFRWWSASGSSGTAADPFDVYRLLRVVNPSPYMGYLQAEGCILVASSPEILCRVRREQDGFVLTNRPLAGTRMVRPKRDREPNTVARR